MSLLSTTHIVLHRIGTHTQGILPNARAESAGIVFLRLAHLFVNSVNRKRDIKCFTEVVFVDSTAIVFHHFRTMEGGKKG